MARPDLIKSFLAGGVAYQLLYSQNAKFRIEERMAKIPRDKSWGDVETQILLWAGLEGARLRTGSRKNPFTEDDAGDIIEAMRTDGLVPINIVMEAWRAANPPAEEKSGEEENAAPANPTKRG